MKHVTCLCIALLLASCASPTQAPPTGVAFPPTGEATLEPGITGPLPSAVPAPSAEVVTPNPTLAPTPDLVGTIVASGPSIDVTFDGQTCTIAGPTEVTRGEQAVAFHNLSQGGAYAWVGRNYPGRTWQDILHDMGTPGSYSAPEGVAIMAWDHSVIVGPELSYQVYTFAMAGEYHVVAQAHGDYFWPCGPFFVIGPQ